MDISINNRVKFSFVSINKNDVLDLVNNNNTRPSKRVFCVKILCKQHMVYQLAVQINFQEILFSLHFQPLCLPTIFAMEM